MYRAHKSILAAYLLAIASASAAWPWYWHTNSVRDMLVFTNVYGEAITGTVKDARAYDCQWASYERRFDKQYRYPADGTVDPGKGYNIYRDEHSNLTNAKAHIKWACPRFINWSNIVEAGSWKDYITNQSNNYEWSGSQWVVDPGIDIKSAPHFTWETLLVAAGLPHQVVTNICTNEVEGWTVGNWTTEYVIVTNECLSYTKTWFDYTPWRDLAGVSDFEALVYTNISTTTNCYWLYDDGDCVDGCWTCDPPVTVTAVYNDVIAPGYSSSDYGWKHVPKAFNMMCYEDVYSDSYWNGSVNGYVLDVPNMIQRELCMAGGGTAPTNVLWTRDGMMTDTFCAHWDTVPSETNNPASMPIEMVVELAIEGSSANFPPAGPREGITVKYGDIIVGKLHTNIAYDAEVLWVTFYPTNAFDYNPSATFFHNDPLYNLSLAADCVSGGGGGAGYYYTHFDISALAGGSATAAVSVTMPTCVEPQNPDDDYSRGFHTEGLYYYRHMNVTNGFKYQAEY